MFCNLLDIESDRHLSPTTQTIPVHKVWIVLLMFEKGEREFSGIMYVKESDRAILYTAVILAAPGGFSATDFYFIGPAYGTIFNSREGNGKPPWQICETVSMQPHHSAV